MENAGYEDRVSRNWGFVSPELQKALSLTRVLLAGCGLGSNLARDLAQMGVQHFTLYDGDAVERSNLNRQAYTESQIGMPKARATAENVRSINPSAEVEAYDFYIDDLGQIRNEIDNCDFVLNTVDYASNVFLSLTEYAQGQDKWVFFPTNIGFGAVLINFAPGGMKMSEYLEVDPGTVCNMTVFLKRVARDYLPSHLAPLYQQLVEVGGATAMTSIPQVIPGAQLVSALVCTALCAVLDGKSVKTAPEFTAVDLWTEV